MDPKLKTLNPWHRFIYTSRQDSACPSANARARCTSCLTSVVRINESYWMSSCGSNNEFHTFSLCHSSPKRQLSIFRRCTMRQAIRTSHVWESYVLNDRCSTRTDHMAAHLPPEVLVLCHDRVAVRFGLEARLCRRNCDLLAVLVRASDKGDVPPP